MYITHSLSASKKLLLKLYEFSYYLASHSPNRLYRFNGLMRCSSPLLEAVGKHTSKHHNHLNSTTNIKFYLEKFSTISQ
jgi:hypothetical protein